MVDKVEKSAQSASLQLAAFGSVRCGPIAPAIGRLERRGELGTPSGCGLGFALFTLIQNTQKEDPSHLLHILQSVSAVRAAHGVTDVFDGRIQRLRCGAMHIP